MKLKTFHFNSPNTNPKTVPTLVKYKYQTMQNNILTHFHLRRWSTLLTLWPNINTMQWANNNTYQKITPYNDQRMQSWHEQYHHIVTTQYQNNTTMLWQNTTTIQWPNNNRIVTESYRHIGTESCRVWIIPQWLNNAVTCFLFPPSGSDYYKGYL